MEFNFKEIWEKCLPFNIEQKPEEFKQLLDFLFQTKNKKYAGQIQYYIFIMFIMFWIIYVLYGIS
jgi:hypothetical protein